ncbi:unnamed protein product [Caenorhabditis angaria]|uniref:RGS domain-containing protein n=1 Tax=Caenorhabditis angaria TaxID=860376 RepID=A0A9P1J0E1_9PELO|nr:unnamed protein product [Caenorhabditis angaria]
MLMKILTCDCNFMGQNHSGSVGAEKKPVSSVAENGPDKLPYETVYSWALSFDDLMKNRLGQKYFAEFLKGEYSDENILFWQACEELKREKNAEKIEEKARIIYEDFISILSPKEVSLDSRVREIVNSNMSRPSASTFDDAQNQIFTLMQRDSYPRFLASRLYKVSQPPPPQQDQPQTSTFSPSAQPVDQDVEAQQPTASRRRRRRVWRVVAANIMRRFSRRTVPQAQETPQDSPV